MEPDVREAIKQRALSAGEASSRGEEDSIILDGSVLIGCGRTPQG
jgi:hypothetical protein